MLEKNFGLLFYLKKPKNYEKGNKPIYMRIIVDGVPKEISTGRDWEPSRWNAHAQRAAGSKEDAKALNVFLDILQTKVYDARQQLLENNKAITAELLKNSLKGKTERPKMEDRKVDFFDKVVELYAWFEVVVASLIAGLIVASAIYFSTPNPSRLPLAITSLTLSLIIGAF